MTMTMSDRSVRCGALLPLLFLALLWCSCPAQSNQTKTPDPRASGNPLLQQSDAPFGVPRFDRIRAAHFVPAFKAAMARHWKEVEGIAKSGAEPSFGNTVEALDRSGELLLRVTRIFYGLYGANTNDELEKIAKTVTPLLSQHQDDILLHEALFRRVKAVHAKRASLGLDVEQSTLLGELYLDFVRGGADLDASGKKTLRSLNTKLALLQLSFRRNLLEENNRFTLVIHDRKDLAGLPDRVVSAAAKAAAARGHRGKWVFTLHKPSLIPFLQYSQNRTLREKMFQGYITRGNHGDKLDNKQILKRIVALRIQKAKLLGYRTYADFKLRRRMAKTPANVYKLLDRIWKVALPAAKREAAALQALITKEGKGFRLQPWDWWYYSEKQRRAQYDLDDKELRPYFKLDNVLQGAFTVATKLYGLSFAERKDLPGFHPEARAFEVREQGGAHVGILYVDYFPRKSKRGGAWCGSFRRQWKRDGKRIAPLITNVGNFTAPTKGKPSLLSFEEVETLFHEFGHALHSLLNDTTYPGSTQGVKVDFVELPSQIMENWASAPQVLKLYARHHETNQPIPDALIAKINRSRHFNQGFVTVEYMAACYLDLAWHTLEQPPTDDVNTFEAKALAKIRMLPEIVVRYRSSYFAHIFSGDYYSAGYYSYLWAQVLDADAFEAFRKAGLFDGRTARAFRKHILSRGGAEDPGVLYQRFRGAEPRIEPLLERKGLKAD